MKSILISILIILSCTQTSFNDKDNFDQMIDAYVFLSENHDLLHIMMGEYKGSPIDSYKLYRNKINPLEHNLYLKPVIFNLNNIQISSDTLKGADKFDALVDYYQMGLQIMIEGILKGYGYKNTMPKNSEEYLKIKKINFND
tara:strand:+ start:3339 stop:3764 length:426 start_codon:yes stop_codon:yes gene_type:complete